MKVEAMDDGIASERDLTERYASARARLMGPLPQPTKPAKPRMAVTRPKREPVEPEPTAPMQPEPAPQTASANDNDEHGPIFALPLSADMPLEEKAAALLALVPTVGIGRFRQLIVLTARAFNISARDIRGPSRRAEHVVPRQIAMVIAAHTFGVSLPAIGRAFGGRDHTTVLHARNKYGDMIRGLIDAPTTNEKVSHVCG